GEGDILPLLLDFVQLLHIHVPVPGTHAFFQFGAGNNIPHHRVDDVVEASATAALVPHTAQNLQGVDNAPAGGGVHLDKLPAQGGDLGDVPVPDQQALVVAAHLLDEGQFPVQPRGADHIPLGFTKLHDDGLFGLVHHEGGGKQGEGHHHRQNHSH